MDRAPRHGSSPERSRRARIGALGEEATLQRYLRSGYRLVARNWRCPAGEIDLVVERDGLLAICEVKTRSGRGFGGGYEAVTWEKQRKLRRLAELFMAVSGMTPDRIRFDVASVEARPRVTPSIEIYEDAF